MIISILTILIIKTVLLIIIRITIILTMTVLLMIMLSSRPSAGCEPTVVQNEII